MSVFQFDNYKVFVNARVRQMPKQGRGEFQKLAITLQMHTTSVSQVFKGQKDLTLEQAARLCSHWGLNQYESNYFITLVEYERAGCSELKKILRNRMGELKKESHELKTRISKDHVLQESERFRFYSEWYYSAIRLLCDIPGFKNADHIAQYLDIPISVVSEVIRFLLSTGLVFEEKGQLKLGPGRTYLEAASSLVSRHHANWRMKAVQSYPKMKHEFDLAVTSPMTLSKDDALKVREILMGAVEQILEINKTSKSEELHFLNVDWLRL